ncbi:SDR family oxidoreductase [Bradyrhizobium sp. AUGA SZCCT0222]|uniref:short-chain dehydrogenase/reductase n=1 Tax=Bradyrhizobium sp. AUGA SZCCT0222 TaxID=2807668 RepID=UPI001BA80728|nr:short-chain dehydrogenase/reductase [Bradyrhizobium sp. AUGA SZCCT0222]MBR1267765.1 SDR family oxidoreductase [Bradyrhizobium sp. AUGA SZCCT0222]
MNLNLSGKRVLVTGGSKGIGMGIARAFAAEGAELILVSRDIDENEASKKVGRPITAVNLDLSQQGAAEQLGGRFPDIDILVNNAGAVPSGSLFDVDEARWRAAWDLKVFGYINMCRTFYPLMVGRGGGTIVNIAGIGAIVKSPAAICIAAGNAAIIVLSQTLGSGSHRDNIRVVAVNPGPVATERLKAAASVQGTQKFNADALLPWARPASVEEIGATVAFLASPMSSYTSGSVVTVDGGLSASAQGL